MGFSKVCEKSCEVNQTFKRFLFVLILFSLDSNPLIFVENNIAGDVLIYLKPADLAEIGIKSVGHRLKILKSVYMLINKYNVKPTGDYYIPPTAKHMNAAANPALVEETPGLIYTSFEIRDERMQLAENEIKRLMSDYSRLREDLLPLYRIAKEYKPLPTPDAPNHSPTTVNATNSPVTAVSASSPPPLHSYSSTPNFNSKKLVKTKGLSSTNPAAVRSPTAADWQQESQDHRNSTVPRISRKSSLSGYNSRDREAVERAGGSTPTAASTSSASPSSSEPFKSLRVTMDDPCYKVLPVALRKYKINADPSEYALLVCYDDQERLLGLNEKPLKIFNELQDAGRKPVFMLRHVSGQKPIQKSGVVVAGTPGGVL